MEGNVKQQNCGIYKIENLINGKVYIGQSKNILRRWQEHKNKYKTLNTKLYLAMREDGIENFDFSIIEICPLELLNEKEQYYIDYFNSANDGYNMNNVDRPQYTISEEVALLIKQDLKDNVLTQMEIANKYLVSHSLISQINTGKMWHNNEISYPIRDNKISIKQNFCVDCGAVIGYKSIRCIKCQKNMQHQIMYNTVSRDQLKQLIRENSFKEAACKLGIHERTIRRYCKRYNLPHTKEGVNSYSDKEWEQI